MKYLLFFLTFISIAASFYVSVFLNISPCILCWVQRILMILIFLIIMLQKIITLKNIYIFSITGSLVALYHIIIQTLQINSATCNIKGNSCNKVEFEIFGFITMPMLSLSIFLIITCLIYFIESSKSS
ncbi:disulfide bond formation protein B [Staphylococcus haemolyticus]|uniref:disulfide bond formation protein B n=1 Tax=Staphylococcus haemolyticus TaxID=1283 RepID=UPI0015D76122